MIQTSALLIAQTAREMFMLYWAFVFFVVSMVAAVFGFGGIADATAGAAQVMFYIFLIFFIISVVAGLSTSEGRRQLK